MRLDSRGRRYPVGTSRGLVSCHDIGGSGSRNDGGGRKRNELPGRECDIPNRAAKKKKTAGKRGRYRFGGHF